MEKLIFILGVIAFLWLQAASARRYVGYYDDMVSEDEPERFHFHSDKSRDEHMRHIQKITAKLRDFLKQKDPYFGGRDSGDDQPEITSDDLPKIGEKFEGDMIMDEGLRRAVLGENSKRSAVEIATEGKKRHWPKGRVPYIIHESFKPLLRKRLKQAIRNFNHYTCIRYVPKAEGDEDYVVFKDGKGCSSSVGRAGGPQDVHLAEGCERIGTVQHEMMHVLGIIHEQSRSDRDEHVEVRFDHIKPKLKNNFRKYDYGQADNMDIPYNFFSVMHYSNYAFSSDEQKTLISKHDPDLKFGQRVQWTCLDVKQINRLYDCPAFECNDDDLIPDMTEHDVTERKRDQIRDLYDDLF